MKRPGPVAFSLLLFAAAVLLACGSNHLESITVTPATADAQDFPNGQVQFTATGVYSNGNRVDPIPALWSQGNPWALTPIAIVIDSTGLASCGSVAGTFPVTATAPRDRSIAVSDMTMNTKQVSGTAMLTCP
jgi:hypothetical protein